MSSNFKFATLYVYIIAPIYEFFYYSLAFVWSSRASRPRQRSRWTAHKCAAVDKCACPCLRGNQESKSNECFRSRTVCFSYICPYRFISPQEIRVPFGHQSGKNSYYFDCHNLWKSLYLQGFSQFKSFLENKIKYYFLYLQRAYLRLFFSNMPASSEIFKCREFESYQPVFFGFFHLWFLTSFFRRLGIQKARNYGLFCTFIYFVSAIWYRWQELNLHSFRNQNLNLARLPVSPHLHIKKIISSTNNFNIISQFFLDVNT